MPCDFTVEEFSDGSAACHLSEHDPIDRMKGMVSIILRPHQTSLETKMRLYNRNAVEKSFLWWENAAVPVNESFSIDKEAGVFKLQTTRIYENASIKKVSRRFTEDCGTRRKRRGVFR